MSIINFVCVFLFIPYLLCIYSFFSEIKTYNIQTISAKIMLLNPKIPKYIIKAANGVLFAPENTPTTPSATTLSFIFSTIQI